MTDQALVSQVLAQTEYTEPPLVKVSQVLAQVEYTLSGSGAGVHPIVTILMTFNLPTSTIHLGTSFFVSTDTTVYNPGITFPDYSDELTDAFYSAKVAGSVRVRVGVEAYSGSDENFAEIVQNYDIRNYWVKLHRYDPELGELDGDDADFYGRVESYELTKSYIDLNLVAEDNPLLQKMLPAELITTDTFHSTALDAGKPVNLVFGWCRDVPLWNVRNDTTSDYYDYLIGYSPIVGLWTGTGLGVKRDGVFVDSAEYTLMDGTAYAGYAILRFTVEQKDFSGKMHNLTACVKGMTFGGVAAIRSFVDVAKQLITDSRMLDSDENFDGASYTAAVTALPEATWMCDIALCEQRTAQDWFDEIFKYIPIEVYRGYDGLWRYTIDQTGSVAYYFGDSDNFYNNCRIERRWSTPASQMIKNLKIQYYFRETLIDNDRKAQYYEITYPFSYYGTDKTIQLPAVNETDTAKAVMSLQYGYQYYSFRWVEISTGPDGRQVTKGDIIRLYDGSAPYQDYIVTATSKNFSGRFVYTCREYAAAIYNDLTDIADPVTFTDGAATVDGPATMVGDYTHEDDTQTAIELTANELAGYDIGGTWNGVLEASTCLVRFPAVRPYTLPEDLTGSIMIAGTAATAETVFTIAKDGSSIGTATFAISGTTATFSFAAATSFAIGDVLTITAPGTADATLADIGWCLVGTKDRNG